MQLALSTDLGPYGEIALGAKEPGPKLRRGWEGGRYWHHCHILIRGHIVAVQPVVGLAGGTKPHQKLRDDLS
jgi:hypothetical protein